MKSRQIVIDNKRITFRLLRESDVYMLIDFFINLDEDVKKWYSPHLFTAAVATEICNDKTKDNKKVIGICDGKIISYCVLYFGLRVWERLRFSRQEIYFFNDEVCTIAPYVSKNFQGKKVGSDMIEYVKEVCQKYKKQWILLYGGVAIKNKPAVNFYKKCGFTVAKKWLHPIKKVMSYDMYMKVSYE